MIARSVVIIQKGEVHMPKMQQCINLTSIEKINSFEHTCYSVELNEKIIQIIKKSSGKIYNPTPIPLSTFEPNATSIINAINQQYFEIKLDDIYLVTCNPFHARLQSHKHKHKGLVTTSDIFMRHLAHQWPENPTEGFGTSCTTLQKKIKVQTCIFAQIEESHTKEMGNYNGTGQ